MEIDGIPIDRRAYAAANWREQLTKALSGMATCRKTVTATITSALTAIVFAGGLAGFAGPAAATECPAGGPFRTG